MRRYASNGVGTLFWRELLDAFGGRSGVNPVAFGRLSARDHRARGNYSVRHYGGAIQDYGSHANEYAVFDGGAMDDGPMANGDFVAHLGGEALIGAVDNGIVLDIDIVPEPDGRDIASQHGSEPYAATIAKRHVSYERRCGRKKAVSAYNRGLTPYRQYVCHIGKDDVNPCGSGETSL